MAWDAPLEADIENYLVRECKKRRILAYKFSTPGRRAAPDRILLMPGGRVAFVECKRPGGLPTKLQQHEHEKLRQQGFRVHVVDTRLEVDRVVQLEEGA